MQMYEIEPSDALSALLKTFDKWGGVVNYVQIGTNDTNPTDNYARQAAVFTAQTVTNRAIKGSAKNFLENKERELEVTDDTLYRIDKRKGVQIRENEAKGQQISLTDFFAPPKMWVGRDELHKLPSWWNRDRFITDLEKFDADGFTILTGSYPSYTFANPPYSLSFLEDGDDPESEETAKKPRNLFDTINQILFDGSTDGLTIYHWSTDWIDFLTFDEGYDWWGSYLWTVSNPRTNIIVGITAATTD